MSHGGRLYLTIAILSVAIVGMFTPIDLLSCKVDLGLITCSDPFPPCDKFVPYHLFIDGKTTIRELIFGGSCRAGTMKSSITGILAL